MVLAGCVQSSVWAYGSSTYATNLGAGSSAIPTTNGGWGAPTLAPNGLIYCLPTASTMDGVDFQKIAVVTPGIVNSSSSNYTKGTIALVTADGSPSRPYIPNTYPTGGDAVWRRYINRGILAPNGLLYFIPDSEGTIVVLNPGTGAANCTWDLKTYTSIATDLGVAGLGNYPFKCAVLGPDGYIYLIPNAGTYTVRIAPRNTSVNNTSTDIYQMGYYNGTTNRSFFADMYNFPKDINGVTLTATQNVRVTGAPDGRQYVGNVASALLHPNGLIYMGGGATRWIFILDTNNWGTSNEIFSAPGLNLSPYIFTGTTSSATAYSKDLFLEKPKSLSVNDVQSVKILYLTDTYRVNTPAATSQLTSLSIDASTNIISSLGSTNQGINLGNTGSLNGIGIQMPNGLLFKPNTATGGNAKYVFTGPNFINTTTFNPTDGPGAIEYMPGIAAGTFKEAMGAYSRSGSSVILPNQKGNVSIVIGGNANPFNFSGELVSIKQYSPDTTYFSYKTEEYPIYNIPSNLTTLPTSLYNSYCNTIK
jgi:hypothetical protein